VHRLEPNYINYRHHSGRGRDGGQGGGGGRGAGYADGIRMETRSNGDMNGDAYNCSSQLEVTDVHSNAIRYTDILLSPRNGPRSGRRSGRHCGFWPDRAHKFQSRSDTRREI
jgi:hypothetical protein